MLTKDTARSLGYWLHDRGQMSKAEALAMPQVNDLAQMLFVSARFAALGSGDDRLHTMHRLEGGLRSESATMVCRQETRGDRHHLRNTREAIAVIEWCTSKALHSWSARLR